VEDVHPDWSLTSMDSTPLVPSTGPIPSLTPHDHDGHDGQVGAEGEVAPTAGQRVVAGLPLSSTVPAGTPGTSVPPTPATGFPGQVNAVAGPSSRPDDSAAVEVEVDVDGNGDGDAATPALKSEVDVIARESGERKRKWAARGYAQDEMEEMERRATA
jgi:hypothetical protein